MIILWPSIMNILFVRCVLEIFEDDFHFANLFTLEMSNSIVFWIWIYWLSILLLTTIIFLFSSLAIWEIWNSAPWFLEILFVFVWSVMSVVMPIVLVATPTVTMKSINRAFHEHLDKLSLYDILICSETKEKHEDHLRIWCWNFYVRRSSMKYSRRINFGWDDEWEENFKKLKRDLFMLKET